MNFAAVDRGGEVEEVEVPQEWAQLGVFEETTDDAPAFIHKVVRPVNAQRGYDLPVSAFTGREDGTWEQGTTAYEKRAVWLSAFRSGILIPVSSATSVRMYAPTLPSVLSCSMNRNNKVSERVLSCCKAQGKQLAGMAFRIQVDVLDCLGCGNCVDVCPGKKEKKALEMVPIATQYGNQQNWDYMVKHVASKASLLDVKMNVKNSQFATPLFEFSGACSGCGETPYIKLITQLYGDRMMIANATGCSSIYGASAPATPYTRNEEGKVPHGPTRSLRTMPSLAMVS